MELKKLQKEKAELEKTVEELRETNKELGEAIKGNENIDISMELSLMARTVTIHIAKYASQLSAKYAGTTYCVSRNIYINDNVSLQMLLHELCHLFIYYGGGDSTIDYNQETVCNIAGLCVEQLMLENGDDIFKKLKDFIE
jgi:hypothetical protein